jgi:DNA-binding transcriptional MerR regulator
MAEASAYLRIGELAAQAGVSVATIKYYIREGLLPPPPVKTGRTMGYYDQAYLERLRLIRRLREEHYLPVRVIREVLEEHGNAPLPARDARLIHQIAPSLLERLDPEGAAVSREALAAAAPEEQLVVLEEMGLIGEETSRRGGERRYSRADLELVRALRHVEDVGLTRERFPLEGLGHYVELLGELARREVRRFTHQMNDVPPAELETLAESALAASEPVVNLLRRKLILRHLRAELAKPGPDPPETPETPETPENEEEP